MTPSKLVLLTEEERETLEELLAGAGGPPSGGAGGVLSGSYPNPGFAVDMATEAELTAGLAGKSGTGHSHTNLPTTEQKAALAAAASPGADNAFVTMADISGGGVVLPTKRVGVPITGEGVTAYTQVPDHCIRPLVHVPYGATRARLRYRNYSALSNVAGAGSLDISGLWLGDPLYTGTARWLGVFASTPEQMLGSMTTPSDAAELTSDWFDIAEADQGKKKAFSFGIDSNGVAVATFYDWKAMQWYGASSAAAAGNAAAPLGTSQSCSIADARIEFDVETDAPLVLVIGDSIPSGYTAGNAGAHPHESWPGALGLREGVLVINAAVGSTRASGTAESKWTGLTDRKWTRFDLTTTTPDLAIIALGTNDFANGATSATALTAMKTIVDHCRGTLGIPKIAFGTVIPRDLAGAAETNRTTFNAALRNLSLGADACFDFDAVIRDPAAPAAGLADFMASGDPHPKFGGHQRMASAVSIGALA